MNKDYVNALHYFQNNVNFKDTEEAFKTYLADEVFEESHKYTLDSIAGVDLVAIVLESESGRVFRTPFVSESLLWYSVYSVAQACSAHRDVMTEYFSMLLLNEKTRAEAYIQAITEMCRAVEESVDEDTDED